MFLPWMFAILTGICISGIFFYNKTQYSKLSFIYIYPLKVAVAHSFDMDVDVAHILKKKTIVFVNLAQFTLVSTKQMGCPFENALTFFIDSSLY